MLGDGGGRRGRGGGGDGALGDGLGQDHLVAHTASRLLLSTDLGGCDKRRGLLGCGCEVELLEYVVGCGVVEHM